MYEDCKPCEVRQQGVDIRRNTLHGQRAIVTGANSGIGEAVARGLAEAGAAVVVNRVSREAHAEQFVEDIRAAGGKAISVRADVSDERREGNDNSRGSGSRHDGRAARADIGDRSS
ncbi:MAG: SDR family NAD(P)-dependent oxidoreductase [Gammaproteobacteria bacterium]